MSRRHRFTLSDSVSPIDYSVMPAKASISAKLDGDPRLRGDDGV